MASVKEIQKKIKSTRDTMKITNAMYLVSSSKLKRAKKRLAETSSYFEELQSTISEILDNFPDMENKFFEQRENKANKKNGYIVITSDKGLCGSYNHSVIRLTEENISHNRDNILFLIGQVGRSYFSKKNVHIENEFLYTVQNPNIHRAGEISESLTEMFLNQYIDEVYVVYTKNISSIKCEPEILRLLPLKSDSFGNIKKGHYKMTAFSPSVEEVMNHIVPNYLKGIIFGALIESFASEQNSRMMAMDAATENAKDVLSRLSLVYNRARQTAITQEITEIVGGIQ